MRMIHRLTPLGLMLAASGVLFAQESVGTVSGVVKGEDGKPLQGVVIEVKSSVLLKSRTAVTNDRGEFRIPVLPPQSDYVITASMSGYLGRKVEGLVINGGQTRNQGFTLKKIGTVETVVEVVATSSAVDKTDTKTATVISTDKLQTLPTGSLNAYGALALAPGVQGNTGYPVIRGGLTGQSQFLVNGISVRDPLVRQGRQFEKVIDDLTQDIQVIQSPMNAKYGFTSGGITNVVTKQGTNEFEGSVRVKLSNPAWAAGTKEVRSRFDRSPSSNILTNYTTPAEENLGRRYEVTLLGPIWKDHITFSYAGRFSPASYVTQTMTNLVAQSWNYVPFPAAGGLGKSWGATATTDVVVGGSQQTLTQQYKIFWQIAAGHQVEYNSTVDKLGPYFTWQFNSIDPNAANFQDSNRGVRGLAYTGVFGNAVLDVKWGKNFSEIQFSSGPGDQINTGVWRSTATSVFDRTSGVYGGTVATNGDPGAGKEKRNSDTFDANLQWIVGKHQLDMGFQRFREITYAPGYPGINNVIYAVPGQLENGQYVVFNPTGKKYFDPNVALGPGDPALYNTGGRVPRAILSSTNGADQDNVDSTVALYANDFWTINDNWNVMAGIRLEKYKVVDRAGTRVSTSSFNPRVQVKYDLNGDGKHVFDVSLGQFRGTIGQGNLGGLFSRRPNNRTQTMFWNQGPAGPDLTNAAYLVDQATLLKLSNYKTYFFSDNDLLYDIDSSLKPETRNSVNVSYRRAYDRGYFRATLVYDQFKDMWYRKGINNVFDIQDFTGGGLAPNKGYKSILTVDPMAKRNYKSLELEWQHNVAMGANYSLDWQGNWTMSRTRSTQTWREGNVASSGASFYDEWNAAGYAPDFYNPEGELEGVSQHHIVKTWFALRVGKPNGVLNELSLLVQYFSGTPYSLGASVVGPASITNNALANPSAGLPRTVFGYFGNNRGQFLNQDSPLSIDLQWNLTIPVYKKVKVFTQMSIYNVMNMMTRGTFGKPSSGVNPDGSTYGYPNADFTFRANTQQFYNWVGGHSGARSFGLDMGLRF